MFRGMREIFELVYAKVTLLFSVSILCILEVIVNYSLNQLYSQADGKCGFDIISANVITGVNTILLYGSMLVFSLVIPLAIYAIYLAYTKRAKWVKVWTAGLYRIMAAQLCAIILFAIWAFWAAVVLLTPGIFELMATVIVVFMLPAVFVFARKALDIKGFLRMVKA